MVVFQVYHDSLGRPLLVQFKRATLLNSVLSLQRPASRGVATRTTWCVRHDDKPERSFVPFSVRGPAYGAVPRFADALLILPWHEGRRWRTFEHFC